MDEPVTLHVVAPSGGDRDRISRAVTALEPTVHDTVADFRRAAEDERCAVIVEVGGGIDRDQLLRLCAEVADRDREWIVLIPEEDGRGELAFRPVSAGFALAASDVDSVLSPEGEEGPLFELHEILRFVARIRHDINNPLTAGMAETQLLLMDLEGEGEVATSLQTIERQLQRIQGLVQDLTRIRRPPPDEA